MVLFLMRLLWWGSSTSQAYYNYAFFYLYKSLKRLVKMPHLQNLCKVIWRLYLVCIYFVFQKFVNAFFILPYQYLSQWSFSKTIVNINFIFAAIIIAEIIKTTTVILVFVIAEQGGVLNRKTSMKPLNLLKTFGSKDIF